MQTAIKTTDIQLHQFIDAIDDKKAEAIYTLFEDDIDTDAQRKKLIQSERGKYLRNEGQSYSWDEMKTMAQNKGSMHEL